MIVGEHARDNDLVVNPCKRKHLTNMRASTSDETLRLKPARDMSLEDSIEFLADDELVEVTPKTVRLRKRSLRASDRKRLDKAAAEFVAP
jgi:GTP-binding protein